MAGSKQISTYTTIQALIPPIDITTYYLNPTLQDAGVYLAFINDQYQMIQNIFVQEGYGILFTDPNIVPSLLSIFIDSNGHLIFDGQNDSNFSIDSNGHLIYTP